MESFLGNALIASSHIEIKGSLGIQKNFLANHMRSRFAIFEESEITCKLWEKMVPSMEVSA
jgi:hypothetical protein